MATEQEYAQLSLYVYNIAETAEQKNRPELPSADWERLEYHPDDLIGFSYGIFRNNATGEVVVSYTGTNENQVADFLLANLPAGVGLSSLQVNAAARVAAQAIATYGAENVKFTGHSLGGGLASIMGVWFDRPATVFDPAPFEATARNPLAVVSAQNWISLVAGLSNPALNSFEVLGNFGTREAAVTSYYTSEEALQLLRMFLPTVTGTENRVEFGVDNMLTRRIDLHSMALLTAGLMSDSFRAATVAVQRSIPLMMDKSLYAYDAATSTKINFLIDLIRSEQGTGDKLTHFGSDLNKLGGNIAGLNQAAQDALIAQGIEWYYWQGTDYAGQEFFTQTGTLLQYTTAQGDGLVGALNKAASYVNKWLTPIANEHGTYGVATTYEQWNVSAGNTGVTAVVRDATKSQIFIGGTGADTFTGGDKADIFFAGAGADILNGAGGNDDLYGGAGDDTLNGGAGTDNYHLEGHDTIEDSDGQGRLKDKAGNLIAGAIEKRTDGTYVFVTDPSISVSKEGGNLTLTLADGTSALIQNFQDGQLGLRLADATAAPQTTRTITGDLAPMDFDPATAGVQSQTDELGNIIGDPAQSEPGRADGFNDSAGNDLIQGLGGNDNIVSLAGGDDRIEGGSGDDWLLGGAGNDIAVGGGGRDAITEGGGNDQIYADEAISISDALAAQDATPTGVQGEGLGGGSGDDLVIGGAGNDVLMGGTGADILIGGAGDDDILGDAMADNILPDWSATRSSSTDANGFTSRATVFTNLNFTNPSSGGDDAIYAGGGADWVRGGWGNDYIDGGAGDDAIVGQEGSDAVFGGTGNDFIMGDDIATALADQGGDYLDGEEGDDTLYGNGGGDQLFGGAGNDKIYADSFTTVAGDDYLDGEEGDDELWGDEGNDILFGGSGVDYLDGGAGDDSLDGEDGNDTLYAGEGSDVLDGGAGDDELAGMEGGDILYGGDGADRLQGDNGTGLNEGDDYLDGEAGDDTLLGEGGNDVLIGGSGADLLSGASGNDELSGDEGTDTLSGGEGDDTLDGGLDNDQLAGDAGNDYLDGGDGDDIIDAGDGNDTAHGGAGVDRIFGRAGDDLLSAEDGNDDLQGGDGADTLDGGGGDDLLFGEAGNDVLSGGDGADQLVGGTENDTLDGGMGNDALWGEAGDDVLAGGAGNDTIQGGLGNDVYQFNRGDGQDRVYDSDATAGNIDRVEFSAGVSSDEVSASQQPFTYDLKLEIDGTSDALTVANYFYSDADKVEEIRFADGTVWTPAFMPMLAQGTGGSDWLAGTAGVDIFKSGAGNDVMEGGAGNDSYRYFRGDGADFISDVDATDGNTDKIVFGADIAPVDVRVSRSGNDLLLTLNAMDSVLVSNYFLNDGVSSSSVEQIKFLYNGTVWDVATVKQMALAGTSGNDALTGYATDDQLLGFAGNDTLQGGSGNDTLDGGAGNDNLQGGAGNDVFVFTRGGGQDTVTDGDTTAGNIDTIQFAADIAPADVKLRRTSFSSLEISVMGDTTVVNVPFQFDANGSSAGGIERIQFLADGSFWDTAVIYAKVSAVTEGDDILFGSDLQNDAINGLSGNDALYGGAGNDTLTGESGNDSLYGGAGNDTYIVGINSGTDMVSEYPGGTATDIDRLMFVDNINYVDVRFTRDGSDLLIESTTKGFNIRLANQFGGDLNANGIEQAIFADGTMLDRAALAHEVMRPTEGNDVLEGDSTNELIDGLGGNDAIYGRGGDDTLRGGMGADSLYGGLGNDTFWYQLGDGFDVITDTDPLTGGGGFDTLNLGAGIKTYTIGVARQGNDLLLLIDNPNGVVIQGYFSQGNFEQIKFDDGTIWDQATIAQKFPINGTNGANTLYGTNSADVINGLDGDDLIYGLAGNDTLDGGDWGVDTLYGGDGNDLLIGHSSYNKLYGDNGDDVLDGHLSLTPIRLDGGAGNDTLWGNGYGGGLYGGAGDDVYIVSNTYVAIDEYANEGVDTAQSSATYTLDANVENLTLTGTLAINGTGNGAGNVLIGNGAKNTLTGGAGDDKLVGGGGTDTLIGGTGNDYYVIDDARDSITELANEGVDTVEVSYTYTLGSDSNLENLSLTEGFQINGTGNALGNVITGNALDNILNGAAGADTMIGGGGNDTFVVDNIGDVIVENSGEGTDTVQSAVSYALSANIENLALTGTAVINGTGNSLNNTLTGNSAANVLAGGAGDDTYIVGAGDTAVESANEGVDTVQSAVTYTLGANVENLTLTGSSVINGTGNNLDNILSGSGNTKANVLAGKLGDDTYIVGSGDTAVENANEGIDTVLSSIAFTLGANLENLTLTGASNINGVGNALDNILIGNSANNTLTGGAGSDTYLLDRGYGSDTIAENDATAGNTDLVLFGSGIATDQLWFSQVGNNLDVSIIGTTDKFTLSNWYLGNQYHVEQFKTSDGAILLDSQVQNLVQAMASFAPPAAGETALPANYANSLNPVIAANWH